MYGSAEADFDKLQAQLDAAQIACQNQAQTQFSQLIARHLLAANQTLIAARQSEVAGKHKVSAAQRKITLYHLDLAASHAKATGKPVREHFSGKAQQYARLLISGIIEFKSLVEWKNCTLRPALKAWFIETVDLFEDAMNYLRFNKMAEAERAALAGLLLQDHVCRAAQDENLGLISIAGRCAKFRLPSEATNLRNVTEILSQTRRKILKGEDAVDQTIREKMHTAYEAAEIIFIEAIMAFADDNKKSVQTKLLAVHTHISTVDQITIEYQHLLKDHLLREHAADEGTLRSAKASAQDLAMTLTAVAQFEHEMNSLQQALETRVDDAELLHLRIMAISRFYRLLHKAYGENNYKETIMFAISARAELQKVHLLLLQAELFSPDKN